MAFTEVLPSELSFISALIQAIGGIIVVYIILSSINLYLNRRRNKQIDKIERDIKEIKNYLMNTKNKKKK